jgi:hypothetical protein
MTDGQDLIRRPGKARIAGPELRGEGQQPLRARPDWVELLFALAAFALLCGFALSVAPRLIEPDDFAYRASVIALSHGHLTLSNPQYQALRAQLQRADGGSVGIAQWHQVAGGHWISEKNPGYPFLAVPFYKLGVIRLAPLFYGLLGCVGLFFGARRWVGRRFAGAVTVALFCSSGVALVFAWRDYMPTFTEASLIAAGAGALLWAVLAQEAGPGGRTAVGLLGFVALEAAVLTRYTDIVILAVAVVSVLAATRWPVIKLPASALWWWLGSVVVFGAGLAAFNGLVYGSPLSTGYQPGEVSFTLGAAWPNLRLMPAYLIATMPVLIAALAGAGWIAVRYVRSRRAGVGAGAAARQAGARRDLAVGAVLALCWVSIWGLYLTYAWTEELAAILGASALQVVRFYVPALGAIALLGAWLLARLPRPIMLAAVVALYGFGYWAYADMRALNLARAAHHVVTRL